MIDYKLILLIYSPILVMLLTLLLKDRFEPSNKSLKSCNWSLIPGIIVVGLLVSNLIVLAFLSQIVLLEKNEYNLYLWEVVSFVYYCLILILSFTFLRCGYKVSVVDTFQLKLSGLSFFLKVCALLSVINVLSMYFLDLNLMVNLRKEDLEFIKSMGPKHLILDGFITIILAPIVEEGVYRGLLYVPLYRKLGRHGAIILSALLWAYVHHFPSPLAIIGTFIFGLILGWLYDRSGSLIPPIILHMLKNSWIVVYYF